MKAERQDAGKRDHEEEAFPRPLAPQERRPALVYVPSRRLAEEVGTVVERLEPFQSPAPRALSDGLYSARD